MRVLFIRHGQSGNKGRPSCSGEARGPPSQDPGLSELGREQAITLCADLLKNVQTPAKVAVLCSPMRRCLQTAWPTVRAMSPAKCYVHGALYEFSCAGTAFQGTSSAAITKEFPAMVPVGFSSAGSWDYRGSSHKETLDDVVLRAQALAQNFLKDFFPLLRKELGGDDGIVVLIFLHQTVGDLLLQLLTEGSALSWQYGSPRFPIKNCGVITCRQDKDGELLKVLSVK